MESTPTPTQDSAASGSADPKYQKKSEKTPNSSGGKPERRARDRGGRGGGKKDEKKNTIFLSTIELSDYLTHAEAAEAISHALSTYASNSPENVRSSLINYLKKQLRAGAKGRNAILESGKIENPSVLTQCVLECAELKLSAKTHIFDYCIYFVYKMVEALLKNEKSVLNRGSMGYTRIYYEILDNLFKIDTNVRREDNPETKEEEGPNTKDSIFGSDPKLESYKDFSEANLTWAKELLKINEALHFHLRSASGEDMTKVASKRCLELIEHKEKEQQNLGLHFIDKYSLYEVVDVQKITREQAELGNVENVVRLLGRQSKLEAEKK